MMEFKAIDKSLYGKYDALVDQSVEGTVFHKSWWYEIFKGYNGINADSVELLGAFENERLLAGFPLPYKKAYGMTWVINTKLTPYGGAVMSRESAEKLVTFHTFSKNVNTGFLKMLHKKGVCLNYMLNISTYDLQPFIWGRYSVTVYHTYLVDLKDLNKTWAGIDKKCRQQTHKLMNRGYQVKTGDIESLVLLNNMSLDRQNHSRLSTELMRKIYSVCRDNNAGEVLTIYKDDKPLASTLFVWDTKRSYCLIGGMNTDFAGYTSLLDWEVMKYTHDTLGLPELDFTASDVKSIEYYLRKFGGTLRNYYGIRDRRLNFLYDIKKTYLN